MTPRARQGYGVTQVPRRIVPETPPPPVPGATRAARSRRSRLRRPLIAATVALVLVAGAAGGYAFYVNSQITRLNVNGLSGGSAGSDKGIENILLVGSTSRCALKKQNAAYGLCSNGVTGVNSDVVMILHLNATTHAVSVLSVPRDLFVPNARAAGANKIDAALSEGPTQLVKAIQQNLAIPIQHYIQLNFETFAGVVDAVGGLRMYFPQPVFDAFSGLNVPAVGCRQLDGIQALQVVRARHLQHRTARSSDDHASWPQEIESDLARIRRNHEFLRVMASAVAHQGLSNPLTDQRIVGAIAPHLEVDSGLSSAHLASLALTFHAVNINTAPQLTLPIVATTFGNYRYKGGSYGDIVWPSQPQDRAVIRQFLGQAANTDTMTGKSLPDRGSITVSVLNGTGQSKAATSAAAALTSLGYTLVHAGDTQPVGRQSETVVYAAPGHTAAAQSVLDRLSGHAILGVNPAMDTPGAQVTVVTGTDFSLQAAATTSKPGVAPAPTTPTASTAPSAAVEALAPWDPRSCTASGTAGP